MNTLISPTQPRPLLPNRRLGHRISAIVKPLYLLSSTSNGGSTKVYAEGRSGRGFTGTANAKQEAGPVKPPATADDNDELSPVVINRIMRRILLYVGLPMGVGLGMLQLFGYLKENHIWDAPLWVVFVTCFVAFGGSALGVPFGALSTSWDPDKEGSLLGFDEASYNWVQMWNEDSD